MLQLVISLRLKLFHSLTERQEYLKPDSSKREGPSAKLCQCISLVLICIIYIYLKALQSLSEKFTRVFFFSFACLCLNVIPKLTNKINGMSHTSSEQPEQNNVIIAAVCSSGCTCVISLKRIEEGHVVGIRFLSACFLQHMDLVILFKLWSKHKNHKT